MTPETLRLMTRVFENLRDFAAKPADRWRGRLVKEVVKRGDGTLAVWWTGTDVLGRTRKSVINSLAEEAAR